MVRALCKAATTGPDMLYEVMLKLTLMIDTTAQTSVWRPGHKSWRADRFEVGRGAQSG